MKSAALITFAYIVAFGMVARAQVDGKLALPREYEIVKVDIKTKPHQLNPQLVNAIDEAIYDGIHNMNSSFLSGNVEIVARSFLTEPLNPGTSFQIYRGTRGVILPIDPSGLPFTGAANLYTITFPGDLVGLPLTLRWIVMHEVLGHYAQYLGVYEIYEFSKKRPGSFDRLMSMPRFVHDFYKVTHPTTGLLELQFFHAVPREKIIAELQTCPLAEGPKKNFINFMNQLYDMAEESPKEYIKFKARLEASASNDIWATSISDDDFELFFQNIKDRGFNLDSLKPAH
jgi:hypothetical protein